MIGKKNNLETLVLKLTVGYSKFNLIVFSIRELFRVCRVFSSNSAAITKIHRKIYPQHYLTKIIQSDGSSFTIRFNNPRMIIKVNIL